MKRKIKTLVLALCLCGAVFSLTACGDIKGIYDFFTDSDFGKAFENLENMDSDDIRNLIENLEESDFKGLIEDLSGIDGDSKSSDYNTDSESREADDSLDGDRSGDSSLDAGSNFDLGNVDGNIYSNSFLGLMCEFDSEWHYYSDDELALVNNITYDDLANAGYEQAKAAMEAGTSYIVMCVQNMETFDLVNISMSYSPIDYSKYLTVEDTIDATISQLEEIYSSQGYQDIYIIRSTTTFMGETVPCIDISVPENGTSVYQRQVISMFNKYTAVVTATSYNDFDTAQEYLDAFSAY